MAKLSKRELAVKAKKKLAVPKVAPRVAPKSVSPLVGAGPLMTGQTRVSSQGPAIGPLLQNQSRPSSSSSKPSSRDLASKAQQSKLNPASSVKAAEASGLLGTMSSAPVGDTVRAGGGGIMDRLKSKGAGAMGSLMETFGKANGDRSLGMASGNAFLTDAQRKDNFNGLIGADTAFAAEDDGMSGLGRALQTASTPDLPTGYGANGETFFNDNNRSSPLASDFARPGTNFTRPGSEEAYLRGEDPRTMDGTAFASATPTNPFGIPTAQADGRNSGDSFKQKQDNWVNPWGDVDISGEGNVSAGPSPYQPTPEEVSQQQNEQYGGGPGPVDQAPPRVTNQLRGSGAFGTGKGVQSDDPYIKELRKAYSSNGGEKWLRKQFEELISALDPTYAQMQKEGTDALNAQLNNDNTKLASVMNANNTGDSEQRAQLMAGQQRDTSTALGNLLAKLSQNKAQDVSGYKSQEAEAMSKYSQNKQQDARTFLEKIQAYKGQQGQGAGRVTGPAVQKTPKLSRNEVFNWAEDALNKGYSWQEIAENAQEQGIGTETGGYLDQLLNQANKQNRYR